MSITVSSLIYYPIKACRGFEVEAAQVERMGLQNDRRMMVVTLEGLQLTQRDHAKLARVIPTLSDSTLTLSAPDFEAIQVPIQKTGTTQTVRVWHNRGVQAIDQGDESAQWFSDWLGVAVRLVHIAQGVQRTLDSQYAIHSDDHTGFADAYPILITSEESLHDLNNRLEVPVPMNRFRPNLVVKGCEAYAEDTWNQIRIGNVELAIVKPCDRCVVTTIDKESLVQSKEPLKTLATYRTQELGAIFGQNIIPLSEGRLQLGMNVDVLR
ncbi:MAG TPA: MOSC N-terminal beta barrel domain-containing protein [Anaerolineales bacterium]|nr:MOSC N-terminal beta barrel domain-containing protein [Anaerolineales bacterium]